MWKRLFFRMIGALFFIGGLYACIDFGADFFPLSAHFLERTLDSFEAFAVLTSLFLGAPALMWVGSRCILLRSFSNTWLNFTVLPIAAWLQKLYDIGLIFEMDRILSLSVVYGVTYILVFNLMSFVHAHWYTPISHEKMGHVSLENPYRPHPTVKVILTILILGSLLTLHPTDIATTVGMLASPFRYLFGLL